MLVAALLLGVLVLGPLTAYPLLRHPDWALMYLLDPSRLPPPLRLALLAGAPLAVLLGALLNIGLLKRQALTAGILLTSFCAAASAGLAVWAGDRLWRVGSHGDFRGGAQAVMPTLVQHRLGLALLLLLPVFALSWWYGVRTLRRRGQHFRW